MVRVTQQLTQRGCLGLVTPGGVFPRPNLVFCVLCFLFLFLEDNRTTLFELIFRFGRRSVGAHRQHTFAQDVAESFVDKGHWPDCEVGFFQRQHAIWPSVLHQRCSLLQDIQ